MAVEDICRFLGTSTLGLFGAGHLGRAIAQGLLAAGMPRASLAICHRGSADTDRALATAGLTDLVGDAASVAGNSRMLLYLVRPQDSRAIAGYELRRDALFVSFLAGVPLANLPVRPGDVRCVRVMPSAPDTIRARDGIAALYPADAPARDLLTALGLAVMPLVHESDIHAFTALGPCLPIALTYWEAQGNTIDEAALARMAAKLALPDYGEILRWANRVRPRKLSEEARSRYLAQAATPGGVTDAILGAMERGAGLAAAMQRGVERSQELAAASEGASR